MGAERLSVIRRWQPYISGFVLVVWLTITIWEWLGSRIQQYDSSLEALFVTCHPALISVSWLALTKAPGSITRGRLLAWLVMLGAVALTAQLIMSESFLQTFWVSWVGTFFLEPAHANTVSVLISTTFIASTVHHGSALETAPRSAFSLVIMPILFAHGLSHMLSRSLIRAVRLSASQDAGEALFGLLSARYDAVFELSEAATLVHASDTFFGLALAAPPQGMQETCGQLLRLHPLAEDSSNESPLSAGKNALFGKNFLEMLSSDADRQQLVSCIQEQKSQWEAQQNGGEDEQELEGSIAASSRRLATAMHVCMQTQAFTEVKLRLYCTVCHDPERSRFRFFFGVCLSESLGHVPHGPEARLAVDSPALSREWVTFDAMSPDKELTEQAIVKAAMFPPGTPLSRALPRRCSIGLDQFVEGMVFEARLGEPRLFTTLKYKSPAGEIVHEQVHMELLRDTREREDPGAVEILLTITGRLREKRNPRSNASSSSAVSARSGFTPRMASIGEGEDGASESGSERVPSFTMEEVDVLEMAAEILAMLPGDQVASEEGTALASEEEDGRTGAVATLALSNEVWAPHAQMPETPAEFDMAAEHPGMASALSL